MKIAYEPHPVTPERKAELIAQGYRILDARFAPACEAAHVVQDERNGTFRKPDTVPEAVAAPKKRGRPAKSEAK